MTGRDATQALKLLAYESGKDIRYIEKELDFLKIIEKDLEILETLKDNFMAYKDLYHDGKWQLTLKQKKVFVEGSKEYELLKEWLEK